jgi:hypothetical protein
VKHKRFANWRKIVFAFLALLVIFSMVVVEILALLQPAP